MATDTGIVIIYDLKNKGKPLTCHRIDAREFLGHPSGRWSASPEKKNIAIKDAEPEKIEEDTGEAMRLKAMSLKALQGLAENSQMPKGWKRMSKPELVGALLIKD